MVDFFHRYARDRPNMCLQRHVLISRPVWQQLELRAGYPHHENVQTRCDTYITQLYTLLSSSVDGRLLSCLGVAR